MVYGANYYYQKTNNVTINPFYCFDFYKTKMKKEKEKYLLRVLPFHPLLKEKKKTNKVCTLFKA